MNNIIDTIIQELCDKHVLKLMEELNLEKYELKIEKTNGEYSAITTSIKEDMLEDCNNLTITKFIKNEEVE